MIQDRAQASGFDEQTQAAEKERLNRRGIWSARLGMALILLGIVALGSIKAADSTAAPAMIFGWLIVISGLLEAVHAFHKRNWGGFLLHLVPCVAAVPDPGECRRAP